ncbi:MAG: YbaB/EbfC family nucleoid-associated protein [Acidobacteriota bacterium]|nr:MAG: YbaB/EbfC family nucleoid-associated protein [Acidobacteriota bacterium]
MKLNQIMKQAQALQEKFKKQLEDLSVEATAGGGMVSVKMNGNKTVLGVTIDPEVVDKDDVEMLQDLVTAAVNEASRKVDEEAQQQLGSMAGSLPGLF